MIWLKRYSIQYNTIQFELQLVVIGSKGVLCLAFTARQEFVGDGVMVFRDKCWQIIQVCFLPT